MRLSATTVHAVSSESNIVSAARSGPADTEAPTLDITTSDASLTEGETATITFTWSESVTGFADGDITTTGGTLASISGSGTTYTATFTPTADSTTDGVITVGAGVVTDAAGNANSAGDTLTMSVDTTESATLTFRYHMWGDHMQDFRLYWERLSDGYDTLLWSQTAGETHDSDDDAWDLATIDMTSDIGETGRFFITVIVEAGASFQSDAAFCDFVVTKGGSTTTIATNTSTWRTHSLANSSNGNSVTAAKNLSTTMAMPTNNSSRLWNINSGSTPSSNTGPDKHHDDDDDSTYIYYENSGGSSSVDKGFKVRMNPTTTI